jgi:hypothetical protein
MKNFIVVMLLLSLAACGGNNYTDNRPADQVRLINITRQWRDTVNTAANETVRGHLLETGVNVIKAHIKDSLQLKFTGWEARVLSVAADPSEPDYTVVSFGMNLNGGAPGEKTRYASLVFTNRWANDEPIAAILKSLKTGDMVLIDGAFKTLQKTIDIDSYNDLSRSKNVLDNPEFRVMISKVVKL